MLLFLTGDIQIGKTRWLERLADDMAAANVAVEGVIAPGVWRARGETFEKLGIDNVLLPGGTRIPFARRRDLAQKDGSFDTGSQAGRAGLRWAIHDESIDLVNGHFKKLGVRAGRSERGCGGPETADGRPGAYPALLVVDELGQLELCRDGGLTEAVRLIDRGATAAHPHALAVVRQTLLDTALARFSRAPWGEMRPISPDDESKALVLGLFDRR